MSEMGGMASKLTDALKERDGLKKEVFTNTYIRVTYAVHEIDKKMLQIV